MTQAEPFVRRTIGVKLQGDPGETVDTGFVRTPNLPSLGLGQGDPGRVRVSYAVEIPAAPENEHGGRGAMRFYEADSAQGAAQTKLFDGADGTFAQPYPWPHGGFLRATFTFPATAVGRWGFTLTVDFYAP